jgi:microcin C transport system permease protein
MSSYIFKRILLMIPTLFGIMLLNYVIVQAAPGGPVEKMLAQTQGMDSDVNARLGSSGDMQGGSSAPSSASNQTSKYKGAQGLDPELVARIERLYGFDKPAHERFWLMIKNYLRLDFGDSFFRDKSVIELIKEKMPVSISLGLWSTLIIYLLSIPLGIKKAIRDGSQFDIWTSSVIIIGYAIPGFLFGVLLIVLFAGGSYWDVFPLRGLTSTNFEQMSFFEQLVDYAWHLVLPVTAIVIGGFATLTMLTKNSFLDEINKQYVVTARAKGLTERSVLYGHVFRNAMLIVIAGMPSALIGIFFTGSMLIEVIFSLDGLGLLGFEAALNRDYPVMFGTLFIFTIVGLFLKLISDLTYVFIDPRIDFESREA